jgi:hypothetical protein
VPFQQEAFFEMPDNCIIGQALLWIDHQEVPIPDDHFVAMGEIPRIYRDLAGARKSLFLALRSGKLRANGIFWGEGPLDDRAVNIPPTQWIWDNVEWVNAIYGPTLSTPHWQKDNAGRYELIEVNTNALFALYPRELGHDTNETATALPQALEQEATERRGRKPYSWEEFYAAIAVMAHLDALPKTQAELEAHMLAWCQARWGKEPGLSTVRQKIGPIYSALTKGRRAFELELG